MSDIVFAPKKVASAGVAALRGGASPFNAVIAMRVEVAEEFPRGTLVVITRDMFDNAAGRMVSAAGSYLDTVAEIFGHSDWLVFRSQQQ